MKEALQRRAALPGMATNDREEAPAGSTFAGTVALLNSCPARSQVVASGRSGSVAPPEPEHLGDTAPETVGATTASSAPSRHCRGRFPIRRQGENWSRFSGMSMHRRRRWPSRRIVDDPGLQVANSLPALAAAQ